MADLNWKAAEERTTKAPGVYLVEVDEAEERTGKTSGDPYFNVRLKDVKGGGTLCYDILMLAGKGAGMGYARLRQLGISDETPSLQAAALVGLRAWVIVAEEEWKDEKRLKVIPKWDDGAKAGYWSEDMPPAPHDNANAFGAAPAVEDEDLPF